MAEGARSDSGSQIHSDGTLRGEFFRTKSGDWRYGTGPFAGLRKKHGLQARQTPKLPDWAVIELNTPPNPRWPGKVGAADFFGERWELK